MDIKRVGNDNMHDILNREFIIYLTDLLIELNYLESLSLALIQGIFKHLLIIS